MKTILIFLLAFFFSSSSFAQKGTRGVTYDAQITRVIDGDTVAFRADFLPDPLKKELSLRVYGVDTPEKAPRAKCEAEQQKAAAASEFTKKAISKATTIQIVLIDWDKYGGRVLGDVFLDDKSLKEMLIKKGLAREYYGDAKQSWCN